MYKWPQGRVIRIVCLILILLIAGDLGYNGAYANLAVGLGANSEGGDHVQKLAFGGLFAAVTLGLVIAGLVVVGFHQRAVDFLINVEHEMKLVEWPPLNSLLYSTLIIAITMAVVGGLIMGVDFVVHKVLFTIVFSERG
jgi:preprotein translocase SecE subunit